MAEILKPDGLNTRWAQGGDILDPGNTKYAQGWEVEIPPRQWFNFLDNRQDEAIAHINQHGIAVWDSVTEYQANKSYVQGSNGSIYKALTTNTNINPTTDGGTNWSLIATLPVASVAESQAWTSNTVLLTALRLADAFKGTNQSFTGNGYQKIPGGLILQWITTSVTTGSGQTFSLPITFPNGVLFSGPGEITEATGNYYFSQVTGITTSSISVAVYGNAAGSAPIAQNGQTVRYFLVGY